MRTNEEFLQALNYMNETVKSEIAAGYDWRYTNSSKKQAHEFQLARKNNMRNTNCCLGVWWGLRIAGVPDEALHWYGIKGGKINWTTKNAKDQALRYFDLFEKRKKVIDLYNNMELCDGDILLGFSSFGHTCAYYGGKLSFDTGHAFCTGSGEGAHFKKFLGSLTCKNNKVNYILRLKDRAHYRVQCGAYTDYDKFMEQMEFVRSKGFPVTRVDEEGFMKVQVGYYSGKTNAERKAAEVSAKGVPVFVKEV